MPLAKDDPRYNQVVYLLGPWVIGSFLDVLLQGVLFCQFANYVTWYPNDKKALKIGVVVLMILTTLKSAQCFAIVWIQNVRYFTDLGGALGLTYTAWWQSGNALMVACIGAYVQSYFIYRLWAISQRMWVVVPVAVVLLFAFVAQFIATYYITVGDGLRIQHWFAAHLSAIFAGDLLMTSFSVYFLLRARRESFAQTKHLVDQLIVLTFQSAAPAAICAMLNLITSQVWGDDKIISTIFNTALPKLYAVSMLYTLNTRQHLSAIHTSNLSSSVNPPTPRTRRTGQSRDDLELGALSGIQVHTQVETMEHIDVLHDIYHTQSNSSRDIKGPSGPDDEWMSGKPSGAL